VLHRGRLLGKSRRIASIDRHVMNCDEHGSDDQQDKPSPEPAVNSDGLGACSGLNGILKIGSPSRGQSRNRNSPV
jgi:hypothetical protein